MDYQELLYYDGSSYSAFYLLNDGRKIAYLDFSIRFAVWTESLNGFSNVAIKAYNFITDELKTIREYDGIEQWTVATAARKIVWWKNIGGSTKIKLWENDTIKTIRSSNKGLYLSDNGVSSVVFNIPMDEDAV